MHNTQRRITDHLSPTIPSSAVLCHQTTEPDFYKEGFDSVPWPSFNPAMVTEDYSTTSSPS